MSSRTLKAAVSVAIAAAFTLTATPAQAAPGPDADVWLELVPTYTNTAVYAYEPWAPKDDWERTNDCVPKMGYHYVNKELLKDPAVDPGEPEALLYEGGSNYSSRKLVAVEWIVQAKPGVARPTLFGKPFQGPEPLPAPLGPSYTLHAWIYKNNPDGLFTAFNPTVKCPAP